MTSGVNFDFLLISSSYHDFIVSYFRSHNTRKSMEIVRRFRKPDSVRFAVIEILESPTFDFATPRQVNRGQERDSTVFHRANIAPGFSDTNQENYA